MTRFLITASMLAALLTLFGCGQKGPLYLPDADQHETAQDKDEPKR